MIIKAITMEKNELEYADFYKQQKDYYNKYAHVHLQYKGRSLYVENIINQLGKFLDNSNNIEILELGCGSGRFSIPLLKRGFSVSGIDFSPTQLNYLRQSAEEAGLETDKLKFYCGPIDELDKIIKNQKFDYLLAFFFFHHQPDIGTTFNKIKNTIKSKGRLIFIEPNRFCPLYIFQFTFCQDMCWSREKGTFTLSIKKIKKALGKAGFNCLAIKRFGLFPPQLLDNCPMLLKVEKFIQGLKIFNYFLPFVLVCAEKE